MRNVIDTHDVLQRTAFAVQNGVHTVRARCPRLLRRNATLISKKARRGRMLSPRKCDQRSPPAGCPAMSRLYITAPAPAARHAPCSMCCCRFAAAAEQRRRRRAPRVIRGTRTVLSSTARSLFAIRVQARRRRGRATLRTEEIPFTEQCPSPSGAAPVTAGMRRRGPAVVRVVHASFRRAASASRQRRHVTSTRSQSLSDPAVVQRPGAMRCSQRTDAPAHIHAACRQVKIVTGGAGKAWYILIKPCCAPQ